MDKTFRLRFALSRSRNRKLVGLVVLVVVLTECGVAADAQQQAKFAKIGWLTSGSPIGTDVRSEVLRQELNKLGYVEGKNLTIEFRSTEGKIDRLPSLAEGLVRLKVDVIYASSATVAAFAKKATQTIPIVFLSSAEPVSAGLVSSLARPGGNLTGFATIAAVLAGKRLGCSRMPFRGSLALQSFGSQRIKGLKNLGKKVNLRPEHSACKFIPWR